MLLREHTDRNMRNEAETHFLEQLLSMQQSMLREIAHVSVAVGEMSVRLMRVEMLVTASSLFTGMCVGVGMAAALLTRRGSS